MVREICSWAGVEWPEPDRSKSQPEMEDTEEYEEEESEEEFTDDDELLDDVPVGTGWPKTSSDQHDIFDIFVWLLTNDQQGMNGHSTGCIPIRIGTICLIPAHIDFSFSI